MASGSFIMADNRMMIDLAKEFSPYPSGRTANDGSFNGTRFREEVLVPAFRSTPEGEHIIIDIDGVRTFGSSFIEEAFGGLIRLGSIPKRIALDRLQIRCSKPHLTMFRDAIVRTLSSAQVA